jgi:hypothetical protein
MDELLPGEKIGETAAKNGTLLYYYIRIPRVAGKDRDWGMFPSCKERHARGQKVMGGEWVSGKWVSGEW